MGGGEFKIVPAKVFGSVIVVIFFDSLKSERSFP